MPISTQEAADALGWSGVVVPNVGVLGQRVSAVVRIDEDVDRWRCAHGWPPHPEPSWFRTWFEPGVTDRVPLPAVDLVGVLVTGSALDGALTSCGTLIGLAPCAVVVPVAAADDALALSELDYYGVGVVVVDDLGRATVLAVPEDRSREFGPSLYGRWLREVLYDRVSQDRRLPPVRCGEAG